MKKVLTVFLSIALVFAMMPGMVFATGEQLYCFDTDVVTVGENGYLSVESGDTLEPIAKPEVEINCASTFYFATKDEAGYKAVKWVSEENCPITWESDKVTCRQGGDDCEYELTISELGDSYKASYTESGTTYALTMKCVPNEGSYSSETATGDDMIATSLEADLGGNYGNNCTLQAGKSKDVQFYVGEDDGSDLSFNTKIPATKEDFAVFDESGEKTADVELTPLEDGKMRITPSSSISRKTTFEIKYIGSEYEFSAGNSFGLTVTASSAKAIKKSSISGLTAKPGKSGIVISFKKMKNADGYKIYRSTKKASGYKLIESVSKNKLFD